MGGTKVRIVPTGGEFGLTSSGKLISPNLPLNLKIRVVMVLVPGMTRHAWSPRAKKSPRKFGMQLTGAQQSGQHGVSPQQLKSEEDVVFSLSNPLAAGDAGTVPPGICGVAEGAAPSGIGGGGDAPG
jgi:hypothetical protein